MMQTLLNPLIYQRFWLTGRTPVKQNSTAKVENNFVRYNATTDDITIEWHGSKISTINN
ncbi:hypothetical protein [Cruoricaptor ignavus]|uniref:Uncharacterized protein n=1 Tax=Cruoricaptor ignavus TaxID=1118202 RepID=A0A7M1T6N5_9FLAO|nr:hypothetical protein [Cruoricaptor ignavus]QOR74532.1 hypothetical protein IMZ16_03605 [Cruoricaptor ignavus]